MAHCQHKEVLQERVVREGNPGPSCPKTPRGVLARGHAGRVIKNLSLRLPPRGSLSIRAWKESEDDLNEDVCDGSLARAPSLSLSLSRALSLSLSLPQPLALPFPLSFSAASPFPLPPTGVSLGLCPRNPQPFALTQRGARRECEALTLCHKTCL